MSTDERPDSLAAQAAAWVPPWERRQRPPDRAYQAAAEAEARAGEPAGVDASEPAGVDEPLGEDGDPTDADPGPELPLPGAVEEAEEAPEQDGGAPVDAPLPPDGDDAGEVFDAAADDDVSDDGEVDLPFAEELPPFADGDVLPPAATGVGPAPDSAASAPPVVPAQDRGRESTATTRTPEAPSLMADAELAAALEAILLVVDVPVAELQLAQVLEQPTERVAATLDDLSARYTAAGHGFDLRRVAGGWRLYTRPEYAAYVERFVLDGQSVRLTQAALETLAVVAYKQPVTRSRISAIRGVNCDGVMRTLVTRGLIEECGTEPETGAYLYRTTALFLEKLGLNSVDQLPPLAPFLPDDVEEVLDASG